jgi:hypothetical protein
MVLALRKVVANNNGNLREIASEEQAHLTNGDDSTPVPTPEMRQE